MSRQPPPFLFAVARGDSQLPGFVGCLCPAAAAQLTDVIVETNSAAGWQAFSHTPSTNWVGMETGQAKDLEIAPPENGQRWKLWVAYGTEVRGPMLLLAKAEFAVSQRRWPGKGFGVMQGSNSCISGEISK